MILLSADNTPSVYSVPDKVAENLTGYCRKFRRWLETGKHAEKYRIFRSSPSGKREIYAFCFNEQAFVEYLSKWVSLKEPVVLVEHLPNVNRREEVPEKYKDLEWYNF